MKKLQYGAELIKKLNFDFRKLTKYGFINIGRFGRKIFVNKKKRLVIKESYIIGQLPPTSICVPSLVVKKDQIYTTNQVIIQCLAKPNRKSVRLMTKVIEKADRIGYCWLDAFETNSGIYRNKAVIIDW